MTTKNRVTVVMPVHNSEKFVGKAIESILNQTFKDFDFIIVDDGSQDNSGSIVEKYAASDTRITWFKQNNRGIIRTLNEYFGKASTEYLVRMDADDIALPHRLEKQITFLDQHPMVGVTGSSVRCIDEQGSPLPDDGHFPVSHNQILWKMLYSTGLAHPATVIRKDVFVRAGGYDEKAQHVEDYDFFLRAKDFTRFGNLPDELLLYRKHGNSTSVLHAAHQKTEHFRLSKSFLASFGLKSFNDDCIHFIKYSRVNDVESFPLVYKFLFELRARFGDRYKLDKVDEKVIRRDLAVKLSILSLTYKNLNFFRGMMYYLATIWFYPPILYFNLRHRENAKK